jgi:hypothetical protein
MTRYATITRLHGRSSFGSAGGVDIKDDNGKPAFLAGSSYLPGLGSARVAVGERVEILDNGRHWTVVDWPLGEPVQTPEHPLFHPDTHPEPPPVEHHVDASPIARVPRMSQRHEPEPPATLDGLQLLGGILVALDRNNELLGQILHHLKEEAIEPL